MWAEQILNSASEQVKDAPGFPPAVVQERFVGRSGRAALEEVLPFTNIIREYASLSPNTQILDFGVGWGRIARFFQEDIKPEHLHLADVDPEALKWCEDCNVRGSRILLNYTGDLPFADSTLDVAYSYSVFSHLSEASAKHWLNELHRSLKSGGLLVFTTPSLRFLHLVLACHDKKNPNDMERNIGKYMGTNPQEAVRRFENGQHAYGDVGGGGMLSGEFYGWAAIPPAWFESNFASKFVIEEYINDASRFEQAVYIVRRV